MFTDQYQLTMAQLFFRMGLHDKPAQFDHFFRNYPDYGQHKAGFCINAGLEWLLDWMQEAHFRQEDVDYLRTQVGRSGRRMFEDDFLDWLLKHGDFSGISLMAIPEASDEAGLLHRRFALLRELKDRLNNRGLALDTLSMGMSHDLETAIAEGATMVRIGTAIFGARQYPATGH